MHQHTLIRDIRKLARKNVTAFVADETKKDFLSIPQQALDPAARARRLGYEAPYWKFETYSTALNNAGLGGLTTAAPGGFLGTAQLQSELMLLYGQVEVSVDFFQNNIAQDMFFSCQPVLSCLQHLDSYLPIHAALPQEYQAAAFRFWDSDYAFARERITSSPAFIKRVNSLGEVPFT